MKNGQGRLICMFFLLIQVQITNDEDVRCCTRPRWSRRSLWIWPSPSVCQEIRPPALRSVTATINSAGLKTTERPSGRAPTNLHRDKLADELHAVALHVLAGPVGHVLVEPSQQNGAHHDGDVQAEPGQEAAALQGHVGSPDDQSLPGTVRQREKVVTGKKNVLELQNCVLIFSFRSCCAPGVKLTKKQKCRKYLSFVALKLVGKGGGPSSLVPSPGDAVFSVSRDVQITWPLARRQDKLCCRVKRLLLSFVGRLTERKKTTKKQDSGFNKTHWTSSAALAAEILCQEN